MAARGHQLRQDYDLLLIRRRGCLPASRWRMAIVGLVRTSRKSRLNGLPRCVASVSTSFAFLLAIRRCWTARKPNIDLYPGYGTGAATACISCASSSAGNETVHPCLSFLKTWFARHCFPCIGTSSEHHGSGYGEGELQTHSVSLSLGASTKKGRRGLRMPHSGSNNPNSDCN